MLRKNVDVKKRSIVLSANNAASAPDLVRSVISEGRSQGGRSDISGTGEEYRDVVAVDLEVVAEDVAFLDPPARLEDEGVFRTVSAKVPKAFSKSGFLLIKSRSGQ